MGYSAVEFIVHEVPGDCSLPDRILLGVCSNIIRLTSLWLSADMRKSLRKTIATTTNGITSPAASSISPQPKVSTSPTKEAEVRACASVTNGKRWCRQTSYTRTHTCPREARCVERGYYITCTPSVHKPVTIHRCEHANVKS